MDEFKELDEEIITLIKNDKIDGVFPNAWHGSVNKGPEDILSNPL